MEWYLFFTKQQIYFLSNIHWAKQRFMLFSTEIHLLSILSRKTLCFLGCFIKCLSFTVSYKIYQNYLLTPHQMLIIITNSTIKMPTHLKYLLTGKVKSGIAQFHEGLQNYMSINKPDQIEKDDILQMTLSSVFYLTVWFKFHWTCDWSCSWTSKWHKVSIGWLGTVLLRFQSTKISQNWAFI